MKAKAYYAVQDSHEMGMGQKFVKTSPVLHEFKSEKARDYSQRLDAAVPHLFAPVPANVCTLS